MTYTIRVAEPHFVPGASPLALAVPLTGFLLSQIAQAYRADLRSHARGSTGDDAARDKIGQGAARLPAGPRRPNAVAFCASQPWL